jgi:hypothetical protein
VTPALILALLALLAIGASPTRAAPHKIHFSSPEVVSERIEVPASNGYRLEATAQRVHYSTAEQEKRTEGGPAFVTNFMLTLKRGPAEASYTPGGPTMDAGATTAHLGAVGDVSLRFVPRRVTRKRPAKGCVGRAIRIEHGDFVGLLRFDGEGGYTRLLRRRVPGTVTRQFALRCDLVPTVVHEHGSTRVGGSPTAATTRSASRRNA